jgi:hypothetical protein
MTFIAVPCRREKNSCGFSRGVWQESSKREHKNPRGTQDKTARVPG